MTTRPSPRHRQLIGASIAVVVATIGSAASTFPAAGATPTASPDVGGTAFGSGFGYTMTLPPGWQVTLAAGEPAGGEDLFEGPDGASARVGGGPADPTHTVAERVAANRDEATADGICVSDPAEDAPTILGSEPAIAWSWTCPDSYHAAVNTLHDGLRLRLQVDVPLAAKPTASAMLEAFRSTFTFLGEVGSPGADADLAAIEGALEGSYETQWHPVELELAAVEAAGLERPGDPGWEEWSASVGTIRHVITFENGSMAQYCAADNGPLEICWRALYRLLDGDTIESIEGPHRVEYAFTLRDGILVIDVVGAWLDGVPNDDDMIPLVAIFETLPFTRVP